MQRNSIEVLVVDDDRRLVESLSGVLGSNCRVYGASSRDEAMALLAKPFAAVLVDICLSPNDESNRDGLDLLSELRLTRPNLPVIVMTGYGDIDLAVDAMKRGAVDFIQKGQLDLREIREVVKAAIERGRLAQRVESLEAELERLEPSNIVGEHSSIQGIRRLIKGIAQDGEVNVLIVGETGTGKELVARAIHRQGMRADGPFRAFCPASLNPSLVESELFGCEEGAYTDAQRRSGWLEMAHQGVLFLDEVGDLPVETQVKLLRFLEERQLSRVGSTDTIEIDTQVIAATNRDLGEQVSSGQFRSDLLYRINTITVHIPPLRDRRSDIPLLVEHFLAVFRKQGRTSALRVSEDALECMLRYDWPGNVRELRSAVENAVIFARLSGRTEPLAEDLPADVRHPAAAIGSANLIPGSKNIDLRRQMATHELYLIANALEQCDGRKSDAWKFLGLNDRFSLLRRVRAIRKIYPEILDEFPAVAEAYGGTTKN